MRKILPKISVSIVIALLALSMILAVLPVSMATITNRPRLWRVTQHKVTTGGELNVTGTFVTADPIETKAQSYENGSLVAINFTGMTITGAQVWLWLSETGGAAIEPGDKWYAGPFSMNDIAETVYDTFPNMTDPYSGMTFWLGNNTIIGPMPTTKIVPKGVLYYVKVTDVNPATPNIPSSDVAVSVNRWKPIPTIAISPTSGPAGTLVTVTGMAFDPTKKINLTFATSNTGLSPVVVGPFSPAANGTFTTTFYAPDLQITTATNATRYVNAYYNITSPTVLDSKAFKECGRRWEQIKTVISPPQGNSNTSPDEPVSVFEVIYIAGRYFNPRGTVTLYMDYNTTAPKVLLSGITLTSDGFFNVTVTIPEVVRGRHLITAVDYSYNLNATVKVLPTLILTPNKGPIGTVVSCAAYGFPPNIEVYIWWYGKVYGVAPYWYNVVNGTIGSNGKFNVTVQFTVFHTYGGSHRVNATRIFDEPNSTISIAETTFTVTPLLVIEPSVIKNDGTLVNATGTGFDPTIGYVANIDNAQLGANVDSSSYGATYLGAWPGALKANNTGDISITFIAAGFRPGTHVLSLYPEVAGPSYAPAVYALFTVLSEGDPIAEVILSMNGTLIDLLTAMDAKIVDIQDGVALILTRFGPINTALTALEAKIDTLDGDVATISTKIGTIQTSLDNIGTKVTSIIGDVATIKTDLGTLSGKVTAIDGSIATIKTDLGTIKADISGLKTSVSDTKSAVDSTKSAVDGMGTAVWAAVILALIAAIAAIVGVFQISRKIAG
ncbi:MAG: hypothetical protein QXZ25_00545 [Candidatus Bathyarchaeia archaeon]